MSTVARRAELEAAVASAAGWRRAEAMAELASMVHGGERDRAGRLAAEARDLLESTPAEPGFEGQHGAALAQSLTVLAVDRLAARDHESALELAGRAKEIAGRAGAARSLVVAESVMSSVLVARGAIDEARDILVRRLEEIPGTAAERSDLRARVLNDLGRVDFHAGRPDVARRRFLEALHLLRGRGNTRVEATCVTNLANALSQLGDVEGALDAYAEALALNRAAGSSRGAALALHNLSAIHHRLGDYEASVQYSRDAEIELACGDPDSISSPNLLERADSLLALGETQEALDCCERAMALDAASGNDVGVARGLTSRASVLGSLGRNDEALADAQRALATFDGLGDPSWRIACGQVIAQLHLGKGLAALALRTAEPLLEEARAIGDHRLQIDLARLVVRCAGRAGKADLALACGERLLALEAEARREERKERVETLKVRLQLEQARRREDGLKDAQADLEATVAARTRELTEANDSLRAAIEARDRGEAERLRLEEQLHHAQKMEAIGRLAGGVAHDFKNLLTVIGLSSELLRARLEADDGGRKLADEIQDATSRGIALTRQLLAIGRESEIVARRLDPGDVIRAAEPLLRRIAGDAVELRVRLGHEGARVDADPSHLDQVLLNLVSNARDAMPDGGTLTVETRRVDVSPKRAALHAGARSGPHVLISVADTGHGMDAATRARIFEPFFTTKDAAKGTGLGLSVVFGVVQQCGGFVELESEPGRGATFLVHLPDVAAS